MANFLSSFTYMEYIRPETNILLWMLFQHCRILCKGPKLSIKCSYIVFCVFFHTSYDNWVWVLGSQDILKRETKKCNYIWSKALSHSTFFDETMIVNYGWLNRKPWHFHKHFNDMTYGAHYTRENQHIFHQCNISSIAVLTEL